MWRHTVGTPHTDDVMIFEEPDERFWVGIGLSRSERFLSVSSASKVTSEVWLLDAATPEAGLTVVAPRRQGVEYQVAHQARADGTERLLILHNDGAQNFELATAPVARPGEWTPLIPGRADTRLLGVDAFTGYLAVYYRRDGLTGLRIIRGDDSEHDVAFPEPVYTVSPGGNPEPASSLYRLHYTSLVTPDSVYDCDMATGELLLRRRTPVRPLPGSGPLGRPRTSSTGSGPPPRTAPGCRCRWCAGAAPRGTAPRRACCTGTAATRSRWTPGSPSPGCPCWSAASCTRSRTSAAAVNSAAAGTTTGRCCARPTPSPTSWRAPGTWPRRAGRRRAGSWRAADRRAAC